VQDSVVLFDGGKIVFANQRFADMIGCQRSDIIGKNEYTFLASGVREDFVSKLNEEQDSSQEFCILLMS
jgi:PAS domain-containing protein